MRPPYLTDDLASICEHIQTSTKGLPQLERQARLAWEEEQHAAYYPSGGDGGRGGPAYSNPTHDHAEALADTPSADPLRRDLRASYDDLRQALTLIDRARSRYSRITTPAQRPDEPEASGNPDDWCTVCLAVQVKDQHTGRRHGVVSPTSRIASYRDQTERARCDKCDQWAAAADIDPDMPPERPALLIRLQAAGRMKDYARELGAILTSA